MVDIKGNLKKQAQDWRENWSVSVPVDGQKVLLLGRGCKFKFKLEDKLRIDPRHSAYYTLLWIAYVDNHCNLHHVLKTKVSRYPRRMEWNNNKKKFQDTKVIYRWHLSAVQHPKYLLVKLERFITEECLSGY